MATKTKKAAEPKLNSYASGPDERGHFDDVSNEIPRRSGVAVLNHRLG